MIPDIGGCSGLPCYFLPGLRCYAVLYLWRGGWRFIARRSARFYLVGDLISIQTVAKAFRGLQLSQFSCKMRLQQRRGNAVQAITQAVRINSSLVKPRHTRSGMQGSVLVFQHQVRCCWSDRSRGIQTANESNWTECQGFTVVTERPVRQ